MPVVSEAKAETPPTSPLKVVAPEPLVSASEEAPFKVELKVIALLACVAPVPPVKVARTASAVKVTAPI